MTDEMIASRRSFLKVGALLAAPVMAAVPVVAAAEDGTKARLARLEDETAIRDLHRTWLRSVNAGERDAAASLFRHPRHASIEEGLRRITADHGWEQQAITLSADGQHAAGLFPCDVEIERAMAADCTLAQMAHAQGGGWVRHRERRMLSVDYVKGETGWALVRADFAPLPA